MFCVGTSESIRLQDVFEGNIDSFITSFPYLCEDASDWIRRYGYYSKQYLQYLDDILSGDPPRKIANRPGVNVTSIQELRQRIRVPLRDSYDLDDFEHEEEEEETPVWSPPYADGEDWDDKQLDEDEERYWPSDDDVEQGDKELKNRESEEEDKENNNADDVRVQKVGMNMVKDHISRSSIFRFTTAVAPSSVDFLGTHGCYGAINMFRMNTSHCQPFITPPGRMKVSEVKSSLAGRLHNFSAWRKLQFFTKFLNKFR
jgi:hypothetical protein